MKIEPPLGCWKIGTRVRKKSGSSWHGRVCGYYSTSLTPVGYDVESEREPGSVQLYPAAALEFVEGPSILEPMKIAPHPKCRCVEYSAICPDCEQCEGCCKCEA